MWPDGIRCAVSLTFGLDVETPWIAKDPAHAQRPGPLSMARYSTRVAIPLILDLLKRQDIRATFFIPGKVAEDHPGTVESIIATLHPQVIGRPSRIKMLDGFIDFVKSHEGVWITTCSDVAGYVRRVIKE